MSSEIPSVLEPLFANVTHIRKLANMTLLVFREPGFLFEPRVAEFAPVFTPDGANAPVLSKIPSSNETFSAIFAPKRRLSGVQLLVLQQILFPREPFGAKSAGKRPFASVNQLVSREHVFLLVAFLAYIAPVRALGIVN